MATPKFLATHGTAGANASAGLPFAECQWYFGGYAIPLLDPVENHARYSAMSPGCEPGWLPYTDYHVRTTNTCTMLVGEREQWRTYIQDPELVTDHKEGDDPPPEPLSSPDNTDFPSTCAGVDPNIRRYPLDAVWAAEPHFKPDYIAFVDSRDGGVTFPIYAPIMSIGKFPKGAVCADKDTDSTANPDFTNAGWTPTCVPCRTITADTDGVYSVYRNVSVLDLHEEWGFYVMFAIECRTAAAYAPGEDCHPCGNPRTTACPDVMPYTRYVVFLSDSPDFPDGGHTSPADGTWPDPLLHTRVVAVVQPDSGSLGPASGSLPNESYGVSHALLSPDKSEILVYVGSSTHFGGVDGAEPARVAAFYGKLRPQFPGLAAFRFDTDDFMSRLLAIALFDRFVPDPDIAFAMRSAFAYKSDAAYQGDVLVVTSTSDFGVGNQICKIVNPKDATWIFCGGCDNQLHLYWDQAAGDSFSDKPMVQLWRAVSASWNDLPAFGRSLAAALNGPDTIFVVPDECPTVFDMQADLGLSGSTPVVMDPDVAVLASGRIRVSFNQGAEEWGQGLVCAYGPPAACAAVPLPDFRWGVPVAAKQAVIAPPPHLPFPANLPAFGAAGGLAEQVVQIFAEAERPTTRSRQDHLIACVSAACEGAGLALPRGTDGMLVNPFTGTSIADSDGSLRASLHPITRLHARAASARLLKIG